MHEGEEEKEPKLSAKISIIGEPKADTWMEATLSVRNIGLAEAKDIIISVDGIEKEGLLAILNLPTDAIEILKMKVNVRSAGTTPVELRLKCARASDGKEFVFKEKRDIHIPIIEEKKETQWYRRYAATTPLKCGICMRIIKPGFIVIRCECRTTFHEDCTTPVIKCPACKRSFEDLPQKKNIAVAKEAGFDRIETLKG